jgi:hypothetical protein
MSFWRLVLDLLPSRFARIEDASSSLLVQSLVDAEALDLVCPTFCSAGCWRFDVKLTLSPRITEDLRLCAGISIFARHPYPSPKMPYVLLRFEML